MLRLILFSILSFSALFAGSFSIKLKKDSWNLVGTATDINISSLGLGSSDYLWHYKDGNWTTNRSDQNYTQITSLSDGDAFWVYSTSDKNISLSNASTIENPIAKSWQMYSPNKNLHVESAFNDDSIAIVWYYDTNGTWLGWDNKGVYAEHNITKAENIVVGQGAWVYARNSYSIPGGVVNIGYSDTALVDGNFTKVVKYTTDSIEDIWNISFEVNSSNISDFKIGVKLLKESSGATGEVVFQGMNIVNGVLSNPSYIVVHGVNGEGVNGQLSFSSTNSAHDNIISNAMTLNNNVLTLKIGTLMKEQNVVSQTSFKGVSNYKIELNSDLLSIENSKTISLGDITDFTYGTAFDNKNGIGGYIEIK